MIERRILTPKGTITAEPEISEFLNKAREYNAGATKLLFKLQPVAAAFIPVTGIVGRLEVKNSAGVWELRKEIVRVPDVTVLDPNTENPVQAYYFQFRQVSPAILISVQSDPWCRSLQVEIAKETERIFREKKQALVQKALEDMQRVLETYFHKRM